MVKRILIADPNKTVRLAAQMVFAKTPDIILSTAINPFETLDKMHLFQPAIAFLDEAFARELYSNLKRLPAPVEILMKPFTSKGLQIQVEQALAKLEQNLAQENTQAQAG